VIEHLVLAGALAFGEPTVAWQLGRCWDTLGGTECARIGQPFLDERVCRAVAKSMKDHGVERVVCAKVLIDE
jgi:hypothetical protein